MKKPLLIIMAFVVLLLGGYFVLPFFNNIEVQDEVPEAFKEMVSQMDEEKNKEVDVEIKKETPEISEVKKEEEIAAVKEPEVLVQEVVSQEINPLAPVALGPFPVMGTLGHPAEGTARFLSNGESAFIRYEDFKTINGPNLHVYLSKDKKATDFIDLGPIKGTEGNINYPIPEGVDIKDYPFVLTWCVPFKVLFNHALIE